MDSNKIVGLKKGTHVWLSLNQKVESIFSPSAFYTIMKLPWLTECDKGDAVLLLNLGFRQFCTFTCSGCFFLISDPCSIRWRREWQPTSPGCRKGPVKGNRMLCLMAPAGFPAYSQYQLSAIWEIILDVAAKLIIQMTAITADTAHSRRTSQLDPGNPQSRTMKIIDCFCWQGVCYISVNFEQGLQCGKFSSCSYCYFIILGVDSISLPVLYRVCDI